MTDSPRTWTAGPPLDRMAALVAQADADDAEFGKDDNRRNWHAPAELRPHGKTADRERGGNVRSIGPIKSDRPGERFLSAVLAERWLREHGTPVSQGAIAQAIRTQSRAAGRHWFLVAKRKRATHDGPVQPADGRGDCDASRTGRDVRVTAVRQGRGGADEAGEKAPVGVAA